MSESDDETGCGACGKGLGAEALQRLQDKIDNLPTLEGLMRERDPNEYSDEQVAEAAQVVKDMLARELTSEDDVKRAQRALQKKYHKTFKKSLLLAGYKQLMSCSSNNAPHAASATRHGGATQSDAPERIRDVEDMASASPATTSMYDARCAVLERFLVSKAPRSQSGVLVVTVFTSAYPEGQAFSCQWNCYYCPNEPGQPRSYLLNEPGVRRANRLGFDPVAQFTERVHSLVAIGHPADKVELLVLGGTWESYPAPYRERFIRDLFFAANTIFDEGDQGPRRAPMDLLQEQLINETARCKIIGITLETRPDTVTPGAIAELRRLGCTRVQIGVQHTDDAILRLVNRQATREDTMRALKLLKDSGFKVDIHLMPDLPGASPEIDKAMFDDVLSSPYLQADQWKIYPCQTTPFTVIEQWLREGRYRSYGLEQLIEVILYVKRRVPPWVRLNRIVRDIPSDYVLAGVEVANLRQLLAQRLREEGTYCKCIRCREVKGDKTVAEKVREAVLKERRYAASEGTEVFLSFETADERTIFGFLRLRLHIEHWESPFPELADCALVRELHVYGNLITTYGTGDVAHKAQHSGLGTQLLQRAEQIARDEGYARIAVISGVGVRNYYRKRGYRLHAAQRGAYLIKTLAGQPEAIAAALTATVAEGTSAITRASKEGTRDEGQSASCNSSTTLAVSEQLECNNACQDCVPAAASPGASPGGIGVAPVTRWVPPLCGTVQRWWNRMRKRDRGGNT